MNSLNIPVILALGSYNYGIDRFNTQLLEYIREEFTYINLRNIAVYIDIFIHLLFFIIT